MVAHTDMSVSAEYYLNGIAFKLSLIKYAKERDSGMAERHFGLPAVEKLISVWRKQEEELQKLEMYTNVFCSHAAKWPKLESEVQKWIMDHRNNGISVSTKMICEARRWALAHNINDFAGSAAWCYRFMKRHGVSMHTCTRIV
jgi:hypothetical protein